MSSLPLEVIEMFSQTIAKVVPITIVLALVFTVLTHFWACNPKGPWWRKRELVTDICYWFFVPLFARVLRIGFLVLGAALVFNIHGADELIAFYDNGHGPLSDVNGLKTFSRMLEASLDTVRAGIAAHKSLADIQKAGLPAEWKSWGTGFVKTDFWLETVFKSLSAPPASK